ncbi:hypothetical protein, partial [Salmonella sp. s39606]|uniref:hypothetical protein n=1 Tax=Salmonella sp. s39606 TaxID=3159643 RepID=UPI003980FA74
SWHIYIFFLIAYISSKKCIDGLELGVIGLFCAHEAVTFVSFGLCSCSLGYSRKASNAFFQV